MRSPYLNLLTAEWPRRATIRGRGVLAVTCHLGAQDFATGETLDAQSIENRHYHHIYPDALLKEAEIDGFVALNCALISDRTNMVIGKKDPVEYMKDRYKWTSQEIVAQRFHSHLIPIPELANGGYVGLSEPAKKEKLKKDYEQFLRRRAELVLRAVRLLAEGRLTSSSALGLT